MFGFGRSAQEKAVIQLFSQQFAELGYSASDAKNTATQLVDSTKEKIRASQPQTDFFNTSQGTTFSNNPNFMNHRLKDGVKIEDVLFYWNRPLLVVFCEMEMRQILDSMILQAAINKGEDLDTFAVNSRKNKPKYGDPRQWDNSLKINQMFSQNDADIFLELTKRVDAWTSRHTDAQIAVVLKNYTSFNAMVRDLISKGKL